MKTSELWETWTYSQMILTRMSSRPTFLALLPLHLLGERLRRLLFHHLERLPTSLGASVMAPPVEFPGLKKWSRVAGWVA